MAAFPNVLLLALLGTLTWAALGYPIARVAMPAGLSALAVAPALGWAAFNAAALPILLLTGFTRATVIALILAVLAGSLLATRRLRHRQPAPAGLPAWAWLLAAVAACAPAAAVMPKHVADGVILAAPAFDHSKVAIIDEMTRLGLLPGNPFLGGAEAPTRLAYYYLWHFSAAVVALALAASGWEADIALSWFTAFASLLLIMGLAAWLAGRWAAALWAVPLSLAGSLRSLMDALLGPEKAHGLVSTYAGLGSWIVQASWSPQHLASASCVVLAALVMARLAEPGSAPLVPLLALLAAAGFGSSTWVGGVAFALAAVPVGLLLLAGTGSEERPAFLLRAGAAAVLALALAFPFLRDQYAITMARAAGPLIALHPFEVLGAGWPLALRRPLDLPAYWLVLLPVDLPGFYLAGAVGLVAMLRLRAGPAGGRAAQALGLLAMASLAVSWLLASTLINNDLGWRAVLPAILVGTAAASATLQRWLADRRRLLAVAAIGLAALALPDGLRTVAGNLRGRPTAVAAAFAWTPELWAAVRRHTGPADRVANNPLFLADLTPWAIDAPWAYLSNRRSCYAGWAFVRPFTPLSRARVDELDALFIRVFAGDAAPGEVETLAGRYECALAVVTVEDGAWGRDPFAASPAWRLVEAQANRWRLYAAALSR